MTTPLIMLVLMTAPYLAVRLVSVVLSKDLDAGNAAVGGLSLLFVFTGLGHFILTEPMVLMLPAWVPARTLIVHVTGVLEFAIAGGFLVPRLRRIAGWTGAVVLVLFFPANIYAAVNQVPMGGHAWGPVYLLVRAPLQIIVLLWIYRFAIRADRSGTTI